MSILISADWQLDDNPLNQYRHEFQKELRRIIKREKVKCLLVLGDLTEQKDHHGAWLVNTIVDHLNRLRSLCPVVFVQGNHDYVDINAPFYQFLQHINGIHWIGRPTTHQDHDFPLDLNQDLGRVLLLPHTTNPKKDWYTLKLDKFDWVFTHLTFQDARVSGTIQAQKGINPGTFGKAMVVSGDIHIPQKVRANVIYAGAPYLCDFGDSYEPRVLLLKGGALKSIPVQGPQKRLVEISGLGQLQPGSINIKYCNPGDILKVRYLISSENKANWPELKAKVREWGEKEGYLIHVVQPVVLESLRGRESTKRTQQKQQTDEEMLRTYATHRSIDNLTLKSGLNIMRKV